MVTYVIMEDKDLSSYIVDTLAADALVTKVIAA